MPRTITVGLDGSAESRAAADWAAREAKARGLAVRLVHVWEPVPGPMAQAPLLGPETHQHWTERIPREAAAELRERHPGVEVTVEQLTGQPAESLVHAAEDAELLVLGSRGLGGIGGFLVGSVGLAVVAATERPVVLVRAAGPAAGERAKDRTGAPAEVPSSAPVVLGVDTRHPAAAPIEFAFEAAARQGAPLRVLHGWSEPSYPYGMGPDVEALRMVERGDVDALTEVLQPWRHKHPDVKVIVESRTGGRSAALIDASREASLVVVGRRVRRSALGARIGPVAHAVLHHSTAPVAVVAHD
ncbi:universal stress protein [Streptomyces sp. NPDC004684]|uniref:universal stress protein n=1 Tax=unclassified Streptomyces TaxID=2593676 RepID=UPI0013CA31BA|nr:MULTISPECIES: universal stress protein [unclassified Streptomyces]NED36639.1 universal stress protein [Streptomyces sp. SID8499]NED72453.1 universal stress protein [Streptomyces sp. SID9944]NMO34288.1 universal stress protein [Streptomyces sp. GMY02]